MVLLSALSLPRSSRAQEWLDKLGGVAIQDGGRTMPLESYARRVAVELTGRRQWSKDRGPEAYAGRKPMQLLLDLMFGGQEMLRKRLIAIENRPFKKLVGLDAQTRFFSGVEIVTNAGINRLLGEFEEARRINPQAQPTKDQRRAIELRNAVEHIAAFSSGEPLAIVPGENGGPFLKVSPSAGDPGTEGVRAALVALGKAYTSNSGVEKAAADLRASIDGVGKLGAREARSVGLELFYDRHDPWRKTAVFYGLAILLLGMSRLVLRRPLVIAGIVAAGAGVVEHIAGVGLRVAILHRAPVSNTFEALLWMGLVAIGVGVGAQLLNRKGFYLFGALCAALVSVLFAGLVPLEDQTNSLPAVLRSNFWLTIHVLTIVASYGVLALASVLGHVFLAREVLFRPRGAVVVESKLSHPLIAQTYRTIQIGLVLLTAGTILGGVWAADSWGRFWGWDPKETWALISILVYFAVLHARYSRWLRDFGLAAASVLGFVVIVWTFYGVNYVMATGLHSYGFGSGGEVWVGLWAIVELAFLAACRVRFVMLRARRAPRAEAAPQPPALPPQLKHAVD